MNSKTIIGLFILFLVVLGLLSYDQISKKSIQKIAGETPGYMCLEDKPCVSCMVEGNLCDCGPKACQCGARIVDRTVCG